MDLDPTRFPPAMQEFLSSSQLSQIGEDIPLETIHDTILPTSPHNLFRTTCTPEDNHRATDITSVIHDAPHEEGTTIAALSATLLKRPSPNFLNDAWEQEPEALYLARPFFNNNGTINTARNPVIAKIAREAGHLLIINAIEVDPEHRHPDLGLQLLYRTLIHLHSRWQLAIMKPLPFSYQLQWELQQYPDQERPDLIRHFARLGFVQLGRDVERAALLYLPSTKFFPSPKSPIPIISKEHSHTIKLHTPTPYQPAGINKTLFEKLYCRQNPITAMIPDSSTYFLLDQYLSAGATVHASRALHIIAAGAIKPDLITLLLRHAADLNARDEDGNTALHKAAEMISPSITYLVQHGADTTLTNHENETPFDIFLHSLRVDQANVNHYDDEPTPDKYRIADLRNGFIALLPKQLASKLICGYIPPRLHEMLKLTAIHASMTIDHVIDQVFIKNNTNTTKISNLGGYAILLDYMPERVLLDNQHSFHKHLLLAWKDIFYGIALCLHQRKLPTVQRISASLKCDNNIVSLEYFLGHGGRIEYAIDGVISVTESIVERCALLYELWLYEEFESDIEALEETCLDPLYNVVRAMCLQGCEDIPHGPYEASTELLCDTD